jgi:abortive infection bacteriophage resistance protein
MDAIERIEVAIRAQLSNHMSLKYGTWYLDEVISTGNTITTDFWKTLNRNAVVAKKPLSTLPIKIHLSQIATELVVAELLTYGQLSKVYDNLASFKDQRP